MSIQYHQTPISEWVEPYENPAAKIAGLQQQLTDEQLKVKRLLDTLCYIRAESGDRHDDLYAIEQTIFYCETMTPAERAQIEEGDNALKATVGDTVRVYFGVGGPNVISSFHVIGEIFDRVYPEGALGNPQHNVQTTLVPAGGATMVEFKIDVPGTYLLVDHSLSRLFKGAVGQLVATGPEDPAVFGPVR